MADQPVEEKELTLINKLELRIALATDEKKLETLLKTYLAPLLLKLNSPHFSVVKKTAEVSQHISLRINSLNIQLPVLALLKQLKEHGDSKPLRIVDAGYIRTGISRIKSQDELNEIFRDGILQGISRYLSPPSPAGAMLLYFLFQILPLVQIPRRGDPANQGYRESLGITKEDAKALTFWFGKMLLLPYDQSGRDIESHYLSQSHSEFLQVSEIANAWNTDAPLGLSIAKTKLSILDFVDTGAFTDHERLLTYLFAGPETNPSGISDRGARYIKAAKLDDDEDIIAALYRAYSGDSIITSTANELAATRTTPITLRTRILTILSRSQKISRFSTEAKRIIGDGLADKSSGLVGQRFNSAFVSYIVHTFRLMDKSFRQESALSLISNLKDFITTVQGWPKPDPASDLQIRGQAYRLIGMAAQEGNILDLQLLDFLFSSLNEDNSGREIMLFVEEAISSITLALSKEPLLNNYASALEEWLVKTADNMKPTKQFGASPKRIHKSYPFILSRIANRCLPYHSVAARYVNFAALGTTPLTYEAKEEANNGLNPYVFKTNNSHRPDLWYDGTNVEDLKLLEPDCCHFLWPNYASLAKALFPEIEINDHLVKSESNALQTLRSRWNSSPNAYLVSIKFLYQMFFMEAIASNKQNVGKLMVNESLETLIELSLEQSIWKGKGLELHLIQPTRLLFATLTAFAVSNGSEASYGQQIFTSLLGSGFKPPHIRFLGTAFHQLIPAIGSSNSGTRKSAAQCFGILYSGLVIFESGSQFQNVSNEFGELTGTSLSDVISAWVSDGSSSPQSWGGFLSLSHALCRLSSHGDIDQLYPGVFPLSDFITSFSQRFVQESNTEGLDFAAECVGLLGYWGVFGRIIKLQANEVLGEGKPFGVMDIVSKLKKLASDGSETAILNLGRFSIWMDEEADSITLDSISQALRQCHELKQTATQFTVGKALSYLAFGNLGETDISSIQLPTRQRLFHETLTNTIKDCLQPKPSLRRSATIWLLCLVEKGDTERMQSFLPDCQKAFTACLSNRDELTREAAAKGLNIIFEKGNREIQEKLIQDFTETFTGSKSGVLSGAVSEQTELFDEGTLRTDDKSSISTYKDILDLASEMGNPGLVYQFMSLAADSAIWTSRVALANGLSTDLSDKLEKQMLENKSFFPVLFRYRFDPNPSVRYSMQTLWKSFAKKPSEILDIHFDAIMQDLLKNILSKLWRWRESSCRALADLIQDQKFEKYEKYLEEIWRSCAKVMDDIKSSVRAAALDLAKTLSNVLVRKLESKDSSKDAVVMVNLVVPFLLSPDMLEAPAEEVKAWAISTLLKIVKESRGIVIESQAPQLLQSFLDLFTSLESGMVNWLHLNADKYNIDQTDIDKARVTGTVRDNPIMRAVEKLIDNVYKDPRTTEKMVVVLEESAKTALSLPSLAATSHVMVTMMLRYHARYKTYSDRLLMATRKPMLDRNPTVQGHFAYAAGYIARWASDGQILDTTDYCWRLYRDSTIAAHRATAGEVFHSIAKHAPETFSRLSYRLLPYVFIGKHDDEKDVKEAFKKAWDESTGGQRAILLHLQETMKIASDLLDENKWTLKHAGARAIAEATEAVSSLGEVVAPAEAPKIWPSLEKALGGKSWEGKEVVLKAFVDLLEKAKEFWREDEKIAGQINKIMLREARRQNRAYQTHSFLLLGQYAAARKDLNLSEQILEIVTPAIDELTATDEDAMDVDDDKSKVNDSDRDAILLGAIKALREGLYSPLALASSDHLSHLIAHLALLKQANSTHSRPVSLAIFTSLFERILPDLALAPSVPKITSSEKAKVTSLLIDILFQPRYHSFPEDGRLDRAKAISALARCSSSGWRDVAKEVLQGDGRLGEAVEVERIPRVKEVLVKAGRQLE